MQGGTRAVWSRPTGGSLTRMQWAGTPALRRSQLPPHGSIPSASHNVQGTHFAQCLNLLRLL